MTGERGGTGEPGGQNGRRRGGRGYRAGELVAIRRQECRERQPGGIPSFDGSQPLNERWEQTTGTTAGVPGGRTVEEGGEHQ